MDFGVNEGDGISLPLLDKDYHLFLPFEVFQKHNSTILPSQVAVPATAVTSTALSAALSWPYAKSIIDCVHKHLFGRTNLSGIKFLLLHNGAWSSESYKYLSSVVARWKPCHAT